MTSDIHRSAAGEEYDEIGTQEFECILKAGLKGLQEIVEAKVGDKTLADTLSPAAHELPDSGFFAHPASFQNCCIYALICSRHTHSNFFTDT